ncbi:MAG: T9SS type A sorting domain-containing protein [Ignavibacteria bacterium]|nr:T9SS type A sorting domain-containing protein [Ignavibacteria bacterium]
MASNDEQVVLLRSTMSAIDQDVVRTLKDNLWFRDVIVQGDTIVGIDPSGTALYSAGNGEDLIRTPLLEDSYRRLTLDRRGRLYAVTDMARLYVQGNSVRDQMKMALENGTNYRVLSTVKQTTEDGTIDLVVVVQQRSGNGFASTMVAFSEDMPRFTIFPDTLANFNVGTIVDSVVYIARMEGGLFYSVRDKWHQVSGTLSSELRSANHFAEFSSAQVKVLRYSFEMPTWPAQLTVFADEALAAKFNSYDEPKMDSIGAVSMFDQSPTSGCLIAGTKGLAYATNVNSSWDSRLKGEIGALLRLKDAGVIASLGGNRVALSRDNGVDWRTYVLSGIFGGFYRAREIGKFFALDGGFGSYVITRDPTADTLVPLRLVNNSFAIGASGDTVLSVGMYKGFPQPNTGRIVFRRNVGTQILDSNVVSIEKPVNLLSLKILQLPNGVLLYDRIESRMILIRNQEIVRDVTLPWSLREPFQSSTSTSAAIWHPSLLVRCVPDLGVWDTIDLEDYFGSTTIVDQFDLDRNQTRCRPNPVSETIYFDIGEFGTAGRRDATLKLFTLDGKLERDYSAQLSIDNSSKGLDSLALDVSGISTGSYLIVFCWPKGVRSTKVVIER